MTEEVKSETVKKAAEKLQEFLVKEKITLIPQPQFRARDDGTFSVIVALSADYIKKEK